MSGRLAGQSAIVTGAGRGIGLAVSERLAGEGAHVVGLDLAAPDDIATSEVAAGQGTFTLLVCDCRDADAVAAAIDAVEGPIDILVNCAGVNPSPAPITETTPETWDAVLSANLGSVYSVARTVIPRMTRGGAVVNVASVLGLTGVPSCSAYTASKAAIVGLTRSMARDHAPSVRVNCVCPGAIDTQMFDEYLARTRDPAAEKRRIVKEIPLGRMGSPGDVAGAVAFLVSDDAAWMTGSVLVVDGGDTA